VDFAARLTAWQKRHGRHGLPWQQSRDPYAIWLSEIMLQQTQVAAVIPYYQRFLTRFPDISSLAAASLDEVLAHWSGLGYYSRARNLHQAAVLLAAEHGGVFPRDFERIISLPGIGRSTAAAVSVFAFGAREAILDGNVKRVLARHQGIAGYPGATQVAADLWRAAESLLPQREMETYTQALMDLGATICIRARPACAACPVSGDCVARRDDRIAELPAPRPKKAQPLKRTVMLLLLHNDEIFLEKRPPVGIWGGLWSFPEMTLGQRVEDYCLQRFGARAECTDPLPQLAHTFTHFKLEITPQPVILATKPQAVNEGEGVWLDMLDALQAPLPAPVRKLLKQVGNRVAGGARS
jgi:A/G-specific adenine glycosylase